MILGPLGLIINLIQSFRRNWEAITNAFTERGIVEGLKAIGLTILDALLFPLQQVLELMTGLPVVGKAAQNALKGLDLARKIIEFKLNADAGAKFAQQTTANVVSDQDEVNPVPAINTEAVRQESLNQSITEQRQNVSIDINDNTGNATVDSDNDFIPVKLTSTFAF